METAWEHVSERLLLAGVVSMSVLRQEQNIGSAGAGGHRTAEELVGAVPATKTRDGGRGWKLRNGANPFVPSMQREVDGFLADDGVPRWCASGCYGGSAIAGKREDPRTRTHLQDPAGLSANTRAEGHRNFAGDHAMAEVPRAPVDSRETGRK